MHSNNTTMRRRTNTILIVDDTPTNLQILGQALSKHYSVQVATNGLSAIKLLEGADKPDLILLDIMMPEIDGYEVCRRLKQNSNTWNIPVIFVTAKSEVEDQQHGFNLGAVDYITKPFEIPLVLARINVHIRLKLKTELLEHLALLDGLTDIPNRRALEDTLERESNRSIRDKVNLSLLMIDVDFFKAFNDYYGHGAGDECLRQVAQTLEAHMQRPGDFVGRYGGEEFLVILPDCDLTGAINIAEKLREHIEALAIPHIGSETAQHVTISIGVTSKKPIEEADCQQMLLDADRALYLAKSQGRNRVAYG